VSLRRYMGSALRSFACRLDPAGEPAALRTPPVAPSPGNDTEESTYDVLEALVLSGRAVVRIPDCGPAPVFVDVDEDLLDGDRRVVGGQ
jgi:hypothetical protein